MWFNPPAKDRYGSVCFGHPDLQVQAAMNEHGLFVDFTAQNDIDPSKLKLKNPFYGDLFFEILAKCKNVEEALEFLKTHDYAFSSQATLADAQGRSVIINAGAKVENTGHYQINTNFNIIHLESGNYACRRYDITEEALSKASEISVLLFREILSRTAQEGKVSTLYSNIYDLKRGIIYVYLFHNFENVYIIDLKEELKKGYRMENIADHFPASFAHESFTKNHELYSRELMLREISRNGVDETIRYYQDLKGTISGKDSEKRVQQINSDLVEAALFLLRASWIKHSGGKGWVYWYNFPSSYDIWHSNNEMLKAASKIFASLLDETTDPAFDYEMYAYINLILGNKDTAKEYYKKSISVASESSGGYKRGKVMLDKINRL